MADAPGSPGAFEKLLSRAVNSEGMQGAMWDDHDIDSEELRRIMTMNDDEDPGLDIDGLGLDGVDLGLGGGGSGSRSRSGSGSGSGSDGGGAEVKAMYSPPSSSGARRTVGYSHSGAQPLGEYKQAPSQTARDGRDAKVAGGASPSSPSSSFAHGHGQGPGRGIHEVRGIGGGGPDKSVGVVEALAAGGGVGADADQLDGKAGDAGLAATEEDMADAIAGMGIAVAMEGHDERDLIDIDDKDELGGRGVGGAEVPLGYAYEGGGARDAGDIGTEGRRRRGAAGRDGSPVSPVSRDGDMDVDGGGEVRDGMGNGEEDAVGEEDDEEDDDDEDEEEDGGMQCDEWDDDNDPGYYEVAMDQEAFYALESEEQQKMEDEQEEEDEEEAGGRGGAEGGDGAGRHVARLTAAEAESMLLRVASTHGVAGSEGGSDFEGEDDFDGGWDEDEDVEDGKRAAASGAEGTGGAADSAESAEGAGEELEYRRGSDRSDGGHSSVYSQDIAASAASAASVASVASVDDVDGRSETSQECAARMCGEGGGDRGSNDGKVSGGGGGGGGVSGGQQSNDAMYDGGPGAARRQQREGEEKGGGRRMVAQGGGGSGSDAGRKAVSGGAGEVGGAGSAGPVVSVAFEVEEGEDSDDSEFGDARFEAALPTNIPDERRQQSGSTADQVGQDGRQSPSSSSSSLAAAATAVAAKEARAGVGNEEEQEEEQEEEEDIYGYDERAERAHAQKVAEPSLDEGGAAFGRVDESAGWQTTAPGFAPHGEDAQWHKAMRAKKHRVGVESGAAPRVEYDCFHLRVIHERHRTGFEEDKNFKAAPGMVVAGRYEVIDHIGQAAFSDAYACTDLETGEEVCIKVIKNNKDFLDQSLDEIKLLRYVNGAGDVDKHHILRMHDYFYHKEHLFIVCELLRDNLYEFSKFNRESSDPPYFTLGRLRQITQQVLEGLHFIHSLGLIHCDLKPENILMQSYSKCCVKVRREKGGY
jgi:hypothetical protein